MKFGGQPTPWSETETEGLRLRSVSQILIQEIGAAGPENAEDSARRACGVIQRQADQIVSADALIAELEAKVARMRVDSERYRFLREQAPSVPFECKRHVAVHVHDWARALDQNARFNMWSYMQLSGKRLDSEIDAARANGGEG